MWKLILQLLVALHVTTPGDVKCVAQAIYYEARGEDLRGQVMVADVVINRMHRRRLSACGVIHQPDQFSWAAHCPPVREPEAWKTAVQLAVWSFVLPDISRHSTHFVAKWELPNCEWCKHPIQKIVHGGHVFMIPRS